MLSFMRRLILSCALALAALLVAAVTASAASSPVITSVSPKQVAVGGTLVITGKNFKKGVSHNRVFFSRATDGKTVRARPTKANSTKRLEVKVPTAVTTFLTVKDGAAIPTRFKVQVLSGKFSKKTSTPNSPVIYPAGTAPAPNGGGGTGGSTPTITSGSPSAPLPDCDSDGNPDITDTDDDNDGLSDSVETSIHTNICNKDTDGDGVEDAFEYYSALDLNGNALPYPAKRPWPNALDPADGNSDFDGDGLTSKEEFTAWNLYGGRALPAAPGQTFPYSDGNQTSTAANGVGAWDLDNNGRITDDEKDTDGDGLANWVELGKGDAGYNSLSPCQFEDSSPGGYGVYVNVFTNCGAGRVPNGNTFGNVVTPTTAAGTPPPTWLINDRLNWLDSDTDGDGVTDGADDNDFDGLSNIEEITAGTDGLYTEPQDPCHPDMDARACPLHPSHG
jgi:hypothetical protein